MHYSTLAYTLTKIKWHVLKNPQRMKMIHYLSNLWRAENQGVSSQSGYWVCPITRLHNQKILFDLFWPKMPRKVEITVFNFLRGTPNPE